MKKVFDKEIFLHAMAVPLKQKYIWITTTITMSIYLVTQIILAIVQSSNPSQDTFHGDFILFVMVNFTVILLFVTLHVTGIFSSDRELGIMNLELRTGRSRLSIFVSRVIANMVWTLSMIIVLLIIFVIANSTRGETLKYSIMYLAIIPVYLLFFAISLLVSCFNKSKLLIGMQTVFMCAVLITPIMQQLSGIGVDSGKANQTENMKRSYAQEKVLEIIYNSHEGVVVDMVNDYRNVDKIIKIEGTDDEHEGIMNLFLEKLSTQLLTEGLIDKNVIEKYNNSSNSTKYKIYDKYKVNNPDFKNEVEYWDGVTIDFTEEFLVSKIYEINEKMMHENISYEGSIYDSENDDRKEVNRNEKEEYFDSLNDELVKLESLYEDDNSIVELNKIVKSLFWNNNLYKNSVAVFKELLDGFVSTSSPSIVDTLNLLNDATITPEMRIFNSLSYDLIKNSHRDNLTNQKKYMLKQTDFIVPLINPYFMFSVPLYFSSQTSDYIEYNYRNNIPLVPNANYFVYNYSKYTFDKDDKSKIIKQEVEGYKSSFKTVNVTVYHIVLTLISLALLVGAVYILTRTFIK